MCGGFAGSSKPIPRPKFVHVVRPTADHMPELPPYSGEEIECAFPDLFDLLTLTMFLNPSGYDGDLDDEQRASPGSWYALSWGCIHRDTLPIWRSFSREVRKHYWSKCWKWITSFGKKPVFDDIDKKTVALAFLDPLPIRLFERAVFRLTRAGMLDRVTEDHEPTGQTIDIYHPTLALAQRLRRARISCSP